MRNNKMQLQQKSRLAWILRSQKREQPTSNVDVMNTLVSTGRAGKCGVARTGVTEYPMQCAQCVLSRLSRVDLP